MTTRQRKFSLRDGLVDNRPGALSDDVISYSYLHGGLSKWSTHLNLSYPNSEGTTSSRPHRPTRLGT